MVMNALQNPPLFKTDLNVYLVCLSVIIIAFLVLLIHYISILWMINVKFGKPPETSFEIAYRYAYQGRASGNRLFYKMLGSFPSMRGIKLCYTGPKASYIEYAYGLILHKDPSNSCQVIKDFLFRNTFTSFQTPEIFHALYIIFPVVPWIPKYIAHWLAVVVAYMKISASSERHNLCGYPVVEIYERRQVSFIVPLTKQDDFIVWEAERIVFGRHYSAMLRPLTILNNLNNLKKDTCKTPTPRKVPTPRKAKQKRG